jgi:hypothetical protein
MQFLICEHENRKREEEYHLFDIILNFENETRFKWAEVSQPAVIIFHFSVIIYGAQSRNQNP